MVLHFSDYFIFHLFYSCLRKKNKNGHEAANVAYLAKISKQMYLYDLGLYCPEIDHYELKIKACVPYF